MTRLRRRSGVTLLELVIAVFLSAIVLLAVIDAYTSVVKWHFDATKKGKSIGMALYSLDRMYHELENATFLNLPAAAGSIMSGCGNWSVAVNPPWGGIIDAAKPVTSFYYCVCAAGDCVNPLPPARVSLLRYKADACPITPPGACGDPGYSEAVVYQNLRPAGDNYFTRTPYGVDLLYSVGDSTPSYKIGLSIQMNKSFNNGTD